MVVNEKEIEKAYNLFYDYMVKCYGYCDMTYDEFKQFVIKLNDYCDKWNKEHNIGFSV